MPSMISILLISLFASSSEDKPNAWREKAPLALKAWEEKQDLASAKGALDALRRADLWSEAAAVASTAMGKYPNDDELISLAARAFWRAGNVSQATGLAGKLLANSKDPSTLTFLIDLNLSKGEVEMAEALGAALLAAGPKEASDWSALIQICNAKNSNAPLAGYYRNAAKALDPSKGYPDTLMSESIDGVAEFFEKVGSKPINVLEKPGFAEMSLMSMIGLPAVECMINGKGPYRFVVDTGGSIVLSIDTEIAEELGIRSIATASVRGVNGKQESGQSIVDQLSIGSIELSHVLARTFDLPTVMRGSCSGILGTGVFSQSRMALDFQDGKLRVANSSNAAGEGRECPIRIIGDGKLVAPIRIQGEEALAILDSGASSNILAQSARKRLFPDSESRSFRAGAAGVGSGESLSVNMAPAIKLEAFGRTYEKHAAISMDVLDKTLGPILGIHCDFLIGMPLMREMRSMTIDYKRCKMWVDWLPAK